MQSSENSRFWNYFPWGNLTRIESRNPGWGFGARRALWHDKTPELGKSGAFFREVFLQNYTMRGLEGKYFRCSFRTGQPFEMKEN